MRIALTAALIACVAAHAKVTDMTLDYPHGNTTLEAFVAYDDALSTKRPVVVIFHQWMGTGEYEQMRARMLAELGYVAFAADIYGKGVRADNRDRARELATLYRQDRALMRARAQAAIDAARKLPQADPDRVVAIGYCFGGGVALELARGGADIRGAVSFHGNLDTPNPADARKITAKLLVCHGAADDAVPFAQVEAFAREMDDANVDWRLVMYGAAKHSFTDKFAGDRYQEAADRRSWQDMQAFFAEVLK